jgi:pyruvate dehydrogenase E1 component alpha subunit
MDDELKEVVLDAIDFAENSDFPDADAIYDDVYAQEDYPFLA